MPPPETLFQGRLFRVERVFQDTPQGKRPREIVRHNGSAVIVPVVDEYHVCLIENFRISVGRTLLELPAGTLEIGEDPAACAARELTEETGYRAARIEKLHSFYPAPGISDEHMHLYAATGLTLGETARELGEEIENRVVTWDEALRLVATEQIIDAKTILGLLLYDRFRRPK